MNAYFCDMFATKYALGLYFHAAPYGEGCRWKGPVSKPGKWPVKASGTGVHSTNKYLNAPQLKLETPPIFALKGVCHEIFYLQFFS